MSFIRCPRGFRPMESLAHLSKMHSQKFSAFRWISVKKGDHESFQARLQYCPSVFWGWDFSQIKQPKGSKKKRFLFGLWQCLRPRSLRKKVFHQKFPSIFQDTLGQLCNGVLASVWQNNVLSDFQLLNAFMLTPCFVNSFKKANGVDYKSICLLKITH